MTTPNTDTPAAGGEALASPALLRRLLELSDSGAAVIVGERIVFANAAFARQSGADGFAPLVGVDPTALIHPESLAIATDDARRSRGGVPTTEMRMLRLDGSTYHAEVTAIETEVEGAPAVVLTVRDISRRKRAEAELAQLASFAELNPGPVLRIDPRGTILFANPAARRLFGGDVDDTSLCALIGEARNCDWSALIADGRTRSFDQRFDAATYHFVVAGVAGQRVAHVYGTDISETAAAHRELAATLGKLEAVVETSAVGIGMVVDFVVEWTNRRWREIFGAADGEGVGAQAITLYASPRDFTDDYNAAAAERLAAGAIVRRETWLKRGDGSRFWGRIQARAIDPTDLDRGLIIVVEDFTRRKAIEDELRAARDRSEEATRLKDKFVSLVSHDLRSPLASAVGLLQIAGAVPADRAAEVTGRAVRILDGALKLVDQILDVTRLQSGRIAPRRRLVHVRALCEAAMTPISFLAEQKGVALINDAPAGRRIFVDPDLFGEVIKNLLGNAVKFTPAGGNVTLFMPESEPTTVAVADTGPGVDPALAADLFRHEVLTTTKGSDGEPGTGLGLPLAADIVAAHGGSIEVRPGGERGAVFAVTLPDEAPVALVADGDGAWRDRMIDALRSVGAEPIGAADADEAARIVQTRRPDVVAVGLDLPGGGYGFIRRLRREERNRRTPIVAFGGGGGQEEREEALASGADNYLTRTADLTEPLETVRCHIEG
jgi:PAS domain S-box-containing protein